MCWPAHARRAQWSTATGPCVTGLACAAACTRLSDMRHGPRQGRVAQPLLCCACAAPCRYQGVRADAADVPGGAVRRQLPKLFASRLYERLSGLQRAGQLPGKVGPRAGTGTTTVGAWVGVCVKREDTLEAGSSKACRYRHVSAHCGANHRSLLDWAQLPVTSGSAGCSGRGSCRPRWAEGEGNERPR